MTRKTGRLELLLTSGLCALVAVVGCSQQPAGAASEPKPVAPASGAGDDPINEGAPPVQGNQLNGQPAPADAKTSVSAELAAFVAQGDQLLAQAKADLDGDGTADAVIILRHKSAAEGVNPCEILVLKGGDEKFSVVSRSSRVVECTYNTVASHASTLADNLKVSPGEIAYTNQLEKGTSIYRFKYSTERRSWYLAEATNAYPKNSVEGDRVDMVREDVNYPKDFGWTPLDSFDPDALYEAFVKNRKIME